MKHTYRMGLDIGSTTMKAVVLNEEDKIVFTRYERHNTRIQEKLLEMLSALREQVGDVSVTLHVTGSVGMGVAERCGLPFVQEVVAATNYIRQEQNGVSTLIDIGGEDAKVVFFRNGEATDLRMNGNCAGGTGAFIDQMAILLNVQTDELDALAQRADRVYPIASRCGVFSKTDVQNLIARSVSREDIAASVMHAVAVQVAGTLAHGCDILPPVMLCGGPLTFLPALRHAFADYLHLEDSHFILPENAHLIPAWGAALANAKEDVVSLSALRTAICEGLAVNYTPSNALEPIFTDEEDYARWTKRISAGAICQKAFTKGKEDVTIGIDSGSTTTKIVVLNNRDELLFNYYHGNEGNPVAAVEQGLRKLQEEAGKAGTELNITGSCSTGYGEDLIKAAFGLDGGIVETMAHYGAARHLNKDVSFVLDIGGQDMKALFVEDGVIHRIEINEACSSGCGSFLETFAKSLGYKVDEFAQEACRASKPYDLGTRCTVFMNSKVKQALREGASTADIAAGLSYSVVKNCLYKVLRLKHTEELGRHIVVQGGTMRNDAVVRAFEKLTGREVTRSSHPELMGAMGCALYARRYARQGVSLDDMLSHATYATSRQQCQGCENACLITVYRFGNGNRYYSGNRCEKIWGNKGTDYKPGRNAYSRKLELLFGRETRVERPRAVIGIPRCLNMYEEYPFWHTLLSRCDFQVVLSAPSSFSKYEERVRLVMSDNICFPAKLVHSHIQDLADRKVDRIFMPFVVYEHLEGGQNSYNCPIVSGYSEVVRSVQHTGIPLDSPAITFKDEHLLYRQCRKYLSNLGVKDSRIKEAFEEALRAQARYEEELVAYNREVLAQSRAEGGLTVLLAGRPYHADPLIQHKLSDIVASMGVHVITDDIVRGESIPVDDVHFVPQWAYANRILKAAKWAAMQGGDVQCMELTSFGCGPDAFLTDEMRSLLKRYGKTLTLLKIDDVSSTGSLKLRVRSSIESLRFSTRTDEGASPVQPFITTPIFGVEDRKRKILAPFFTPFISPLVPSLMKVAGYDVDNLPGSDETSCDWGLRYANNEVCYPATLIVGDVVKAFKEGKYDPATTAVAITQTGGQCRASNYISLIKKALVESGFGSVPVVSMAFDSGLKNNQPGFKMPWLKMLPIVLNALLYSDCIAKFYYAAVVRETKPGAALQLKDRYLKIARNAIERNAPDDLTALLTNAIKDFNAITCEDKTLPRVGIVGEIYLKFNPFAQKNICEWLIGQGIEVVPPLLSEFFVQSFVNYEVQKASGTDRKRIPAGLIHWLYGKLWKWIEKFNRIGSGYRYFTPFHNIYNESRDASQVVSLNAQFGEGWLLPGEMVSLARQGVNHVISLQPFGCIANHIVSKGIEKRVKDLYPQMRILSLDFDSGVSDVNIVNRLLLFIDGLK